MNWISTLDVENSPSAATVPASPPSREKHDVKPATATPKSYSQDDQTHEPPPSFGDIGERFLEPQKYGLPKADKQWLEDHMTELVVAGFTSRDIYGESGFYTGIAALSLWKKKDLRVELKNGALIFTWHDGHQLIRQSCRPDPRNKRLKSQQPPMKSMPLERLEKLCATCPHYVEHEGLPYCGCDTQEPIRLDQLPDGCRKVQTAIFRPQEGAGPVNIKTIGADGDNNQ